MSRVLIVTERFWPEEFLVNDLARAWKARGDEVEVLTQVPSYPFDAIYDGYENLRLQTTEWEGMPVHRVSTIFGYNHKVSRKVINYLHFGWRTLCWALWFGGRFDRVFVCHTAALTMAMSVAAFRLPWRRRPVTIWTQDLWPDAVWAYGFRRTWLRERLLNCFVRLVYACCDRIAVSCPRYRDRIRQIAGRESEFVPQWDAAAVPPAAPRAHDDGRTVFMFAGNLGVPQNLPNVIRGFRAFRRRGGVAARAELHFLGNGVLYDRLVESCADEPSIVFHGRRPKGEMPLWYARADVMVISLTREFSLTLPAKFQSYAAAGKPMFGVLEGAAADLIAEHELGVTARPDSVDDIAEGFARACRRDFAADGARARALSERMFNREALVARLIDGKAD